MLSLDDEPRLMLKLKLQSFGHLMRRTDSFEKILMLEKPEDRRRRQERMRWLDGITNSWSLLQLMSIKSGMPSNHLILLSSPSPPAFTLSQHQGLF